MILGGEALGKVVALTYLGSIINEQGGSDADLKIGISKVLKVNNNQITSIPKWLPKRLPKLKTVHFHYNQIDTLHQITYLRSLSNLTVFTFEGNPAVNQLIINPNNSSSSDEAAVRNTIEKFDAQSLCRIFIIFHLCSLILLDNREVLPFERQVAEQKFSQVEISRYLNKLNTYESQLKEVETKNSLLKKDLSHEQSQLSETLHKRKLENDLISHLEEELHAKDKLLHLKSEELARACLKHFELEQQLAFHKIDEKLGLVGSCLSKPRRNSSYVHQVPDTGDQPYLGKCMFKYISTNNSINDHSVENKCPSDNHLINIHNKMCSNINDHSDFHKSYLNCLDNKLENDCHDNIHENSNVTHQYSSDIVSGVLIFHCNYVNNPQYIGSEYIHFGNPPNPSKLSGWYNTSDDDTLIKYNPISLIDDNVDDEETPLFKKLLTNNNSGKFANLFGTHSSAIFTNNHIVD
ncbi:unnamed protein product [Schistosoma mattheei]|uniref:Uncharacterized protein n=1 Tax=Schistosoma mattheei TaxID=31246 RepID=A0A183P7P8_9TREM|nr:unnamed protein product [Schistosoma mattheei]